MEKNLVTKAYKIKAQSDLYIKGEDNRYKMFDDAVFDSIIKKIDVPENTVINRTVRKAYRKKGLHGTLQFYINVTIENGENNHSEEFTKIKSQLEKELYITLVDTKEKY